jgi:hypothetical protein
VTHDPTGPTSGGSEEREVDLLAGEHGTHRGERVGLQGEVRFTGTTPGALVTA